MSDRRILHVIPAIAERYGGPSLAIVGMCRALLQRDLDVLIATTDADGPGRLAIPHGEVITYRDVPTIFFRRQYSERFGYSRPLARWLAQHVRSFGVVHIHAVFSHPCLAAARACRRERVPYIVRPLGSLDPWSLRQREAGKWVLWRTGVARMLRSAAAIHYTTQQEKELAETVLSLSGGVVIPLGVDVEAGVDSDAAFRRRWPALGDRPFVLTLSRLHPKKNLGQLIDAFGAIAARNQREEWRLVIAGDGDAAYIDALARQASTLGLRDHVVFPGWLAGAERMAALREAALLALPSQQENFGLAAAEALACGVPVLVSEHVNLAPDIRRHQAGWVASLDSASLTAALADAMRSVAERRRRGDAGRVLAASRFSWTAIAGDLHDLYRTLAANGARHATARLEDCT